MTAYPVSTRVNNSANDSPARIAPLARLPPLEALLNVWEDNGVITKAEVLEEITRLRAKSVKAR
jgi:hypothetical protein